MTLVIYPGSFDPFTTGHLDIVRRARTLGTRVVVAVGHNPDKSGLLPLARRIELIEAATAGIEGVEVASFSGLLADYVREIGANLIIKGVRTGSDLDSEAQQAWVNRQLAGIETVLLPATPGLAPISSSLVRQLAQYDAIVPGLIPEPVQQALNWNLQQAHTQEES